ncbi:glycosyltransferase [Dickeya chrysanthemi]|uniref:glycosyltransferase n=1 Tax=Dickeya chrysanthemi TaxID=556 RepID=UPI00301A7A27
MSNKKRVMWLLNHTAARRFEVPMLKQTGFDEVFLPKSFPADPSFRSASIDWSEDKNLTIPLEDLEILNATDWYSGGTRQAWEIANKWFDAVFFIAYDTDNVKYMANYFTGVCILRAYGLHQPFNYSKWLSLVSTGKGAEYLRKMGKRFVFGIAYEHLSNIETPLIKDKSLYLPLGMNNTEIERVWNGNDKRILFVCPDIAINPYYNQVYKNFVENFSEFDYIVAGAQPIKVIDKRVLGYVTNDEHNQNMCNSRVMFYHSQEPYHIHFHPFEAVKNGMPLVYMAGGLLDKLGGINLPGRCKNIKEAKKKIKSIINGDKKLIEKIVSTQKILLNAMNFEKLKPYWSSGISSILNLKSDVPLVSDNVFKKKKIAVILPVGYLGGSLRGAQLLASAIRRGSQLCNEECQVIFYHQDIDLYSDIEFTDLDTSISIRPFKWKLLNSEDAIRTMAYAGYEDWHPSHECFIIPDDGINYGFDCDLWLIISDRVEVPLLPVKPVVFMVYDYLQRRNNFLDQRINWLLIDAVRRADKVLVTSEFTYNDAFQYAGIKKERLSKVPMLIPDFSIENEKFKVDGYEFSLSNRMDSDKEKYFVWTTNAAPHKNIDKVFEALKIYYEIYNGTMKCVVTGVNTENILQSAEKHILRAKKVYSLSKKMKKNIIFKGNLSDYEYKLVLKSSEFLLHSANGDNGTFSVVEAAFYGVPSLSNFYPAIDEMNKNYNLNLSYFNVFDEHDFANKIKNMELSSSTLKQNLPTVESLKNHTYENYAVNYWAEVKGLL